MYTIGNNKSFKPCDRKNIIRYILLFIYVHWATLLLHVTSFAISGHKVQDEGDEVDIWMGLFAKNLERHKMILWRWSSGIKIFHCYYGFFCCVVIVLIANNAFEIIICIITEIMHLGFLILFRAHVEIWAKRGWW